MVLIHCKYKGEEHSFLYETTVEIAVKDLIKELVEVHNLRLRLQRLKSEGDDLASHGPCKPLDKQGLDEDIQAEADGIELPPRGPTYCKDPIGKRTGDAPVTPAQSHAAQSARRRRGRRVQEAGGGEAPAHEEGAHGAHRPDPRRGHDRIPDGPARVRPGSHR